MGIKDVARKMAQAKAAGGGNYLRAGKGTLIVKALKSETLYAGDTFIAELVVENSENLPDAQENGQQILANAPGTTVSFIQQFEEYPDTAYSNTKAFVFALLGEDENSMAQSAAETKKEMVKAGKPLPTNPVTDQPDWTSVDEFAAAYERLVSSSNPAKGMRLKYSTYFKDTKPKGNKPPIRLTLPKWEHVGQTVEQIKETRAKLDGGQ